MKIIIHITKEVLRQSKDCSALCSIAATNCAIATAVRAIFPEGRTMLSYLTPFPNAPMIPLPEVAQDFIRLFDKLQDSPEKRIELPEFSFQIEVPENIIDTIGIEEVRKILSESTTLSEVS